MVQFPPTVKQLGKSMPFTYLQVSKLVCHSIMDSDRRHKVPGLDTKDNLFLTVLAAARASAFVPSPQTLIPTG